jgi:hypothetical protein
VTRAKLERAESPAWRRAFSFLKQLFISCACDDTACARNDTTPAIRSSTGTVSLPRRLQETAAPQPETMAARIHQRSRKFRGYPEKTIEKNVD